MWCSHFLHFCIFLVSVFVSYSCIFQSFIPKETVLYLFVFHIQLEGWRDVCRAILPVLLRNIVLLHLKKLFIFLKKRYSIWTNPNSIINIDLWNICIETVRLRWKEIRNKMAYNIEWEKKGHLGLDTKGYSFNHE